MPNGTNVKVANQLRSVVEGLQKQALKTGARTLKDYQRLVDAAKLPRGLTIDDVKIPKPGQNPLGRKIVCFTICQAVGPLPPLSFGIRIKPGLVTMVCHRVCVPMPDPIGPVS